MKMVKKIVAICFMLVLVCFGLVGCETEEEKMATAQEGYELALTEWSIIEMNKNKGVLVTVKQLRDSVISCEVRHLDAYSTYYYKINYMDNNGSEKTIYFVYLPIEGQVNPYIDKDYEQVVKLMDQDKEPGLKAEIKVR